MVGRAMDDDASIAELPWASVFDPAANVRALGAIQERGFRAASEVVDRFVRLTARGFGAPSPSTAGEQSESADATADPDLGRMFASIQTLVGKLGQTAMGATAPSEAALDLQNSSATGEARLHAAGAGPTMTEVWLHNRGPEDLGVLHLRCSDLLSHDGALIPASRIRIDPDVVPMPARCSRGVTVEVDVAQEHSPGHYRGTLLADGHSDVWLPLVLNIASRSA